MLTYADVCVLNADRAHLLGTHVGFWRMLAHALTSEFVEEFAPALLQVRLPFHAFGIRQRMLTNADVCWRMLT